MTNRSASSVKYGPWLVALGAALWGTESAWRIPLNNLFDAEVIVFWEHVLILVMFLPLLLMQLREIPRIDARTWGFLIFSAFAGSAVGTIFFTLALKQGNPTVVNVEKKLAALDSGEDAVLYPSGMSAMTSTLMTILSPGAHVVIREAQPAAGQFKVLLAGHERAIGEKAAAGLYVRAR